MKREELQKIWGDPQSWRGGKIFGVYYSKKDPRIFVPKRQPWMGGTINFAHPFAFVALLLCFAIPLLPGFFLVCSGVQSLLVLGGTFLTSLAVLLFWAYYDCYYRHVD